MKLPMLFVSFLKRMMERVVSLHSKVFCFLFLFFLYVCFQANCSSTSSFIPSSSPGTIQLCPPKQSLALLQFRNTTPVGSGPLPLCDDEDSSPKTASWKEGSDCCLWDGVTCDNVTGNVIGLDLQCSWLEGTIQDNSTLFELWHLQWLNLAFNDFSYSQISPEFGRLRELTHLDLRCSPFDGLVPSEISYLSKLNSLDLSACGFSYLSIHQQNFDWLVRNLTKLNVLNLRLMNMSSVRAFPLLNLSSSITVLDLGSTGIQGKFPDEIFTRPNLQELYLYFNRVLTGYFPKSNWSSDLRQLDLSYTNFNGEIPYSTGNLEFLEVLSIGWCNFVGSIPTSINNLTRVKELDLAHNHLTGEQPLLLSKLKRVTKINLAQNILTGQISDIFVNFSFFPPNNNSGAQLPYQVSGISRLTDLDLSGNFLNGRVPSWLFTLPSLKIINLSYNNLTGVIDQFNFSSSLKAIFLKNNRIHGPIPDSIFELVNLIALDISSNNLSGTVNFDRISNRLAQLDLSNNSLLAFSPSTNSNHSLSKLRILIFSSCNVSEFPSFLKTFKKLEWLDLSNNRIHGRILKSKSKGWKSLIALKLSNNFLTYIEEHPWRNIEILDLQNNSIQGSILVPPPSTNAFLASNNKLTGQIPPSICSLTSLAHLGLSNNSLIGKIPQCLGNLSVGLVMLHLQKNNLKGSIPDTFVNGSLLRSLDLSDNELEGKLPRSLVNSSVLEVINVGNNKITDTFPCWLGTFRELKVLVLRSNRFYGPICDSKTTFPFNNLRILDLSHNKFTGFLPRGYFENLTAIMNVDKAESEVGYLKGIYYYDSVNVTMKGGEYRLDRILTIFTSLDLSRNSFQGEIPQVFGNFKSLLVLNLSHNNLTGNIPSSMGNSKALESLDLSSNKLTGEIPEEFERLTFLSTLKLSYNKLSGRIPQGGQFSTFGTDSFVGNIGLCGEPLPVKCRKAINGPSSVSDEEEDTGIVLDWESILMGYASGLVIGLSIGYIVFSTGKLQWLIMKIEGDRRNKGIRRRG